MIFYTIRRHGVHCVLDTEETNHCKNVLRNVPGDTIRVTDGFGNIFVCIIDAYVRKETHCTITHTEITEQVPVNGIQIAIAPTKSMERLEWFVEKATELGIYVIHLIFTQRCERKTVSIERLNKLAISAMKQSIRSFKPQIIVHKSVESYLRHVPAEHFGCVAYISNFPKLHISQVLQPGVWNHVAIGPEGDFTPDEIELFEKHSFVVCSLGKNRLRTETAGVLAATFQYLI